VKTKRKLSSKLRTPTN